MVMIKRRRKGPCVDVSLSVNGRILNSNAPYVEGWRLTLMQIDFDNMLADETALEKLQAATDLTAISGVPGLKIVSTPKVTVEFAR